MGQTLQHFLDYKLYDGWHIFVSAADVVFFVRCTRMPWAALPKFHADISTINPDGTLSSKPWLRNGPL